MAQQGSRLLQVVSILMIIGAAISLLGFLSIFLMAGLLGGGFGIALTLVFLFIGLTGAALQFVSGILGAQNWKNPSKAGACLTWGVVTLLFTLANNLYNVYNTAVNGNDNLWSLLISLVSGILLPVLYIWGASKLKKSGAS